MQRLSHILSLICFIGIHASSSGTKVQFRVEKSEDDPDNANSTRKWGCLRTEFALTISLNDDNGVIEQVEMNSNSKLNTAGSNCDSLLIDFNGDDDDGTLLFDFKEDQSSKGDDDVTIFYLQQFKVRGIKFPNSSSPPVETTIQFTKESNQPAMNLTVTPIESVIECSFKCFNGFVLPDVNNDNVTLSFDFTQFHVEMYPQYDPIAETNAEWKRIFTCDADISKVLPVLVGCVLAAIIILTIAGYWIARRRGRHAYEEL